MSRESSRPIASLREGREFSRPIAPVQTIELSHAAAPEALSAWLESAAPGSQVIYASGPELPRDMPGVELVRRWIAQGLVTAFHQRDARNPARWNFLAIKAGVDNRPDAALHEGLDSPRPNAARHEGRHAVHRPDMARMLKLLSRMADRGEACPSNRELGRMLGLKHRYAARYLFNRLVRDGKIRVTDRGAQLPRVVTIAASGKSTSKGER